jgi:hypothetical protein
MVSRCYISRKESITQKVKALFTEYISIIPHTIASVLLGLMFVLMGG